MNLDELVKRTHAPQPWEEGENIPWNEPGFSKRMLKEHLSQEHDAASRRLEIIDQHVEWIHTNLVEGKPAHILDLACGPGLYMERLARLGHTCHGIDYSPASIEYARSVASKEHLSCTYDQADIREADYPQGMDLVMQIYGEFNVFRPADAKRILKKAWAALKPGGWLLLEPHTYEMVQEIGEEPASWYSSPSGLFSDMPHLVLKENFWQASSHTATKRYYAIDALTGEVSPYAQSMQAYREEEYLSLLSNQGFVEVQILPGLTGASIHTGLIALLGRKP